MEIKIDDRIYYKILDKYNEFIKNNPDKIPNTLILNMEQYRDLWVYTFYNWTRRLNSTHTLTRYCDCDIVIKMVEDIKFEVI